MSIDIASGAVEILTPRLCLRALAEGDAPGLFDAYSDPETMRYWSSPSISALAEAEALLQADLELMADGTALFWAITERSTGKVCGKCTLIHFSWQNRRAELGYILAPRFQRQGLMSEALSGLLDVAFGAFGLHRVEADTDVDNEASIALLEKLGFVREGLLRERWLTHLGWTHSLLYGLLSSDWKPRSARE